MQLSVKHCYMYIVRFLVEKCLVNVNELSDIGETALHVACANNLMDIALYLISKDAEPEVYDLDGKMPADLCESTDFKILIEKAIVRKKSSSSRNLMSPLKEKTPKAKTRPKTMDLGVASPDITTPSASTVIEAHKSMDINSGKVKRLQMMTPQRSLAMTPLPTLRENERPDSSGAGQIKKKLRNASASFDLDDFEREDSGISKHVIERNIEDDSDEEQEEGEENGIIKPLHRPSINFEQYRDDEISDSEDEDEDETICLRVGDNDKRQRPAPQVSDRLFEDGVTESDEEEEADEAGGKDEARNRTPSTVDHLDDTDMSDTDEERTGDVCCVILDEIISGAIDKL